MKFKLLSSNKPLLGRIYILALAICCTLATAAHAQAPYELIPMSSSWKYDQSGRNLGSAWRAFGYDDSAWPSGQGVLAVENSSNALVYPQIRTTLSLTNGTQRLKTYYFRKHFTLTEDPYLVQVVVTNLFDDGAIFYVNGQEFLRTNMPGGPVDFTTGANSSIEAKYATTTIPYSLLVTGDNVLAVELHNASTNSDDVVFGLAATVVHPAPSAIVITNQPKSIVADEDSPVTFSVGVRG